MRYTTNRGSTSLISSWYTKSNVKQYMADSTLEREINTFVWSILFTPCNHLLVPAITVLQIVCGNALNSPAHSNLQAFAVSSDLIRHQKRKSLHPRL